MEEQLRSKIVYYTCYRGRRNTQNIASEAFDLAQDAIDRADEAYEHSRSSSNSSI